MLVLISVQLVFMGGAFIVVCSFAMTLSAIQAKSSGQDIDDDAVFAAWSRAFQSFNTVLIVLVILIIVIDSLVLYLVGIINEPRLGCAPGLGYWFWIIVLGTVIAAATGFSILRQTRVKRNDAEQALVLKRRRLASTGYTTQGHSNTEKDNSSAAFVYLDMQVVFSILLGGFLYASLVEFSKDDTDRVNSASSDYDGIVLADHVWCGAGMCIMLCKISLVAATALHASLASTPDSPGSYAAWAKKHRQLLLFNDQLVRLSWLQ